MKTPDYSFKNGPPAQPSQAQTIHARRDSPSSSNSMRSCRVEPISAAVGEFEAAVVGASDGLSTPWKPAPLAIGARLCGLGWWGVLALGSLYNCTRTCETLVIDLTRQRARWVGMEEGSTRLTSLSDGSCQGRGHEDEGSGEERCDAHCGRSGVIELTMGFSDAKWWETGKIAGAHGP